RRRACTGAAPGHPSATRATAARSAIPGTTMSGTTRRTVPSTPSPHVDPPPLPHTRGPVSAAVLAALRDEPPLRADPADADPYGDDLQLALYCCYELHYRGFAGVPDDREWAPGLLALRREVER